MENNKNEELQSRREFFKKAAKAALPVVGAVVLASLPISNIEAAYDCSADGCRGGCLTTCSSGCKQYCTGGCGGSCRGTCTGTSKKY